MTYLIDTDWVIDHLNHIERVTRRLEELAPAQNPLWRPYSLAPRTFAREVAISARKLPGNGNSTFAFEIADHRGYRIPGRYLNAHVDMIWHQVIDRGKQARACIASPLVRSYHRSRRSAPNTRSSVARTMTEITLFNKAFKHIAEHGGLLQSEISEGLQCTTSRHLYIGGPKVKVLIVNRSIFDCKVIVNHRCYVRLFPALLFAVEPFSMVG